MKLDLIAVLREPCFANIVQPVARTVIHYKEYLARRVVIDDLFTKFMKRVSIEHGGESERQLTTIQGDGAKDVGCLALSERWNPRLHTDFGPRSVQRTVQPETGFILEQHYSPTTLGFFFIAGKRSLIHTACACTSARASFLRGRCTENPSL